MASIPNAREREARRKADEIEAEKLKQEKLAFISEAVKEGGFKLAQAEFLCKKHFELRQRLFNEIDLNRSNVSF